MLDIFPWRPHNYRITPRQYELLVAGLHLLVSFPHFLPLLLPHPPPPAP